MNLKEILDELKNEIHDVVRGSFYQHQNREETELMIHRGIEEEFDIILGKYEEE